MIVSEFAKEVAIERLEKLGYKDVSFVEDVEPAHWLQIHIYGVFKGFDPETEKTLYILMNVSTRKVKTVDTHLDKLERKI